MDAPRPPDLMDAPRPPASQPARCMYSYIAAQHRTTMYFRMYFHHLLFRYSLFATCVHPLL